VEKYSIRSMIQPPQDDYFWYFWASCLEIGKNRIPKITRNNYSVARIIVLKFQNDRIYRIKVFKQIFLSTDGQQWWGQRQTHSITQSKILSSYKNKLQLIWLPALFLRLYCPFELLLGSITVFLYNRFDVWCPITFCQNLCKINTRKCQKGGMIK
jgi:hypothetical protein